MRSDCQAIANEIQDLEEQLAAVGQGIQNCLADAHSPGERQACIREGQAESKPLRAELGKAKQRLEQCLPTMVNWAIVLCKPDDDLSEAQPREFFEALFKGVGNGSIRDYYAELTNDKVDLSGCEILGWFRLKFKKLELTNPTVVHDRQTNIYIACKDISERYGVDFRKYSGVVVIYNYQLGDGGAAGIGAQNTMDLNGANQNYSQLLFDSAAWGEIDEAGRVKLESAWSHTFVAHEVGHGLGLDHSRGANNNDYGDRFDIMSAMDVASYFDKRKFGRSGPGLNPPNLMTLKSIFAENIYQCYLEPNPAHPTKFDDTIELQRLDAAPNSLKAIQIHQNNGTFYTISYRTKSNWDRELGIVGIGILQLHFVDVQGRNSIIDQCEVSKEIKLGSLVLSLGIANETFGRLTLQNAYK